MSASEVNCGALWHSREVDTALKLIRTYLYLYMHVYKRVCYFPDAHLSLHMCKEQIRAENTFDFPIYVDFYYPSLAENVFRTFPEIIIASI